MPSRKLHVYIWSSTVYIWVIIFWLPGNKFSSTMFPMRSLTVGKWASRHIYLIRWRAISWYVWHFGLCSANYQGSCQTGSMWIKGGQLLIVKLYSSFTRQFSSWKTMNYLNNNFKFTVKKQNKKTWFFLVYCTRLLQIIF